MVGLHGIGGGVRIDRKVRYGLGNRFIMKKGVLGFDRVGVVKKYEDEFDTLITERCEVIGDWMLDRVSLGLDVNLCCWCHGELCHGDVIKDWLKRECVMEKDYRVIVSGNREFTEYGVVKEFMDRVVMNDLACVRSGDVGMEVVSGGCRGVDKLGERYGKEFGCGVRVFKAEWGLYGKSGGPIRNGVMGKFSMKEKGVLVSFWDGKKGGSSNMIDVGLKLGIPVYICRIDGDLSYDLFK